MLFNSQKVRKEDNDMENMNWQEKGKKSNPYKVPEGYFEGLENKIMARIQEENQEPVVRKLVPNIVRWVSGIAAAFLIGIIGFQQLHLKPSKLEVQEEIYALVEYYAKDMDDVSFAMLLEDENILQTEEIEINADILDYMDVDEMAIIETLLEVK